MGIYMWNILYVYTILKMFTEKSKPNYLPMENKYTLPYNS